MWAQGSEEKVTLRQRQHGRQRAAQCATVGLHGVSLGIDFAIEAQRGVRFVAMVLAGDLDRAAASVRHFHALRREADIGFEIGTGSGDDFAGDQGE